MTKITLKDLKTIAPYTIFSSGEFLYDGLMKKWIAVRGGGEVDWAIFYGLMFDDLVHIKKYGAKLHEIPKAKELMNCDKNVWEAYRQ